MKISKDLKWLIPFLDAARPLVPKMKKLKKISKNSAQTKKVHRSHAAISFFFETKHYEISMYLQYQKIRKFGDPSTVTLGYYTKIDLLTSLAHELAHLYHWDHTPEHKTLESRLTILFMEMLKNSGYTSEEREIRSLRASDSKR